MNNSEMYTSLGDIFSYTLDTCMKQMDIPSTVLGVRGTNGINSKCIILSIITCSVYVCLLALISQFV